MDEILRRSRVAALLKAIEADLRDRGLWADTSPAPQALASTLPFCVDTLSLEQWLQHIFLPKMQVLIRDGLALPRGAGLAPYAEVAYREDLTAFANLLALLREMDRVLSEHGSH